MTVIAMTREIGSHGTGVAGELNLKIVSSEIVASHVASKLGVTQEVVQRYLEGSASILERWQIDKKKLSRLTAHEVLGIAQQGNVLAELGVGDCFRTCPVLSVRVCAPMTVREAVLMARSGAQDLAQIRQVQIPVHCGQSFRRIADSIPVIADSF